MKKPLDNLTVERLEEFIRQPLENGLTRSEQMELARIALVVSKAQKDAEQFGVGFIVCKPNELPRRADPTKVVLTFTDSGLGHEALI
ncbi:TPA: hypothetical protein ACJ2S6_003574 [Yersinia enterocolitica]|nr:hypothetical protein [Yersinia enterocolitica]